MKYIVCLFICLSLALSSQAQKRITCVGASITYGHMTSDPAHMSFPAQLGKLLGDGYEILNFGSGGCTMLRNGDHSYWKMDAYQDALNSNPDIVLIDLGGNDSRAANQPVYNELVHDSKDMIRSFKDLPSKPRVIILLPTAFFVKDTMQLWDPRCLKEIAPRLQQAAYEENVEVLDMHPLLVDRPDLVPDMVHPEDEGSAILAQRLYEHITQKSDNNFDIFKNIKTPYTETEFKGYASVEFKLKGRDCKIVKPKIAAEGHPWIWRARFWGHEPQTDIALLERGFHLVYCDVSELMGNKEAISIWNDFYKLLTKAGLSKKCTMEGMSRGAMYVLNWAAANSKKVSSVYIDNPLLDCRYLADKDMGQMTKDFMAAYNLKTTEDIRNFKGSPMDKIKDIVKGKYPILILCADEDEAVDPKTQTLLFEKKIKEAGGDITVMMKHGFKHHPHSLPNPAPIVDFILKATLKE